MLRAPMSLQKMTYDAATGTVTGIKSERGLLSALGRSAAATKAERVVVFYITHYPKVGFRDSISYAWDMPLSTDYAERISTGRARILLIASEPVHRITRKISRRATAHRPDQATHGSLGIY